MWTHKESGKIYIGSASNIKTRLLQYFNINYLERNKTMYICNSLKEHGYSAFSLTIFEIIDLTDLSKDSARKKILAREQYYLDKLLELELSNTFNISLTAGSSLGQVRSEETKVKMSEAKLGEKHPFFGKIHSVETKAKMSLSSGTKKKKVFLFTLDSELKDYIVFKEFESCSDAAKFFNCSNRVISHYLDKNKLYKKQWILSSSESICDSK
jgi:group I intron endonuclease